MLEEPGGAGPEEQPRAAVRARQGLRGRADQRVGPEQERAEQREKQAGQQGGEEKGHKNRSLSPTRSLSPGSLDLRTRTINAPPAPAPDRRAATPAMSRPDRPSRVPSRASPSRRAAARSRRWPVPAPSRPG